MSIKPYYLCALLGNKLRDAEIRGFTINHMYKHEVTNMQLMTLAETGAYAKLSRQAIHKQRKAGTFPQPIFLSPRKIVWDKQVIDDWLRNGGINGMRNREVAQ